MNCKLNFNDGHTWRYTRHNRISSVSGPVLRCPLVPARHERRRRVTANLIYISFQLIVLDVPA